MGTGTLTLFFTIALTLTATDLSLEKDQGPCSLTSKYVDVFNVRPQKYYIELTIKPDEKLMSGSVDITIQVNVPIMHISLYARNMEVSKRCSKILAPDENLSLCDQSARYRVTGYIVCEKSDIVIIFFANVVPRGTHVLHVEYSTIFDKNIHLLNFPYSWNGTDHRWLITNLYASDATQALFPRYGAITRVFFQLAVQHDSSYRIFSSMPIKAEYIDKSTGLQWTNITESCLMSPRFFGFAMVDGVTKDPRRHGTHYLWYTTNISRTLLRDVHAIAYSTMDHLHLHRIKRRQWNKVDHIVLPNSPMISASKSGLVIYREKDLTFDEVSEFHGRYIDVEELVAYETTRQLLMTEIGRYSDIVGGDWWTNELLASYNSYLLPKQRQEESNLDLLVVQTLQIALDSDILLEQKPIMHKAKDDKGIDGLLYPLLYHKKAFALIRMLTYIIGPEKFQIAIEEHIKSKGLMTLWTALQKEYLFKNNFLSNVYETRYTIHEIMNSWLEEKHHPEMLFFRNYTDNSVQYRSQNYYYYKCKIPINYATSRNINYYKTSNIIWYEGNQTKYIAGLNSHQYFIANLEQVGYYRVNYDKHNWLLLSDALPSKEIPVVNRAQIVSDAFYFASIGKLEVPTFYKIIKFLRNETNLVVWYPMFNIMSYMSTFFECPESNSVKENTIKGEILKALDGLLTNLGHNIDTEELDEITAMKMLTMKWACRLGNARCRNVTATRLMKSLGSITSLIQPWESELKYTTGMMALKFKDWKTILHHAKITKNQQLLEYLTYSENENIILNYLNVTLVSDPKERLNMAKIYLSILKKHAKKQKVMEYVVDYHYNRTMARFSNDFASATLMGHIIMNMYSRDHLAILHASTSYIFRWNKKFLDICDFLNARRKKQLKSVLKKYKMFIDPSHVAWYKH